MRNDILLIDDEEDIRFVLGVTLKDLGYNVLTAENGEDGLALFLEWKPPVVITDIKMPDIDGLTLLRRIKSDEPDTEVIVITGHGDMFSAIESLHLEATDFIAKPIHVQAIETALARARQNIENRDRLREYTEKLEGLVFEKTARLSEVEQFLELETPDAAMAGFQNRFRQIFNDTPSYLTVHDRDMRLVAVNRRVRDDFGDVIGSPCYSVYRRREEPCKDCPALQVLETGTSQQTMLDLISPDDESFQAMIMAAPMRNSEGQVTHVVVMATNTQQLVDAQDHLSKLGLLIASVSHGVKGLLTGLDGGLYMLESGVRREDMGLTREGLSVVKLMAGRIRGVVMDILLFSKEREIRMRCSSVAALAGEAAESVETKARECGVAFLRDFAPDLGECEMDASFLRTALINGLENAVEACAERKCSCTVRFMVRRESEEIVFIIRDNGPGMDEKTRSRVFNLFFSTKGEKGTGLGLYIAQKIVRQHGGEMFVTSEPGKGTDLVIRIPLKRKGDRPAETETQ